MTDVFSHTFHCPYQLNLLCFTIKTKRYKKSVIIIPEISQFEVHKNQSDFIIS